MLKRNVLIFRDFLMVDFYKTIMDFHTTYSICFEYEEEQGNDCSTLTLAA